MYVGRKDEANGIGCEYDGEVTTDDGKHWEGGLDQGESGGSSR